MLLRFYGMTPYNCLRGFNNEVQHLEEQERPSSKPSALLSNSNIINPKETNEQLRPPARVASAVFHRWVSIPNIFEFTIIVYK